MVSETSRWRTPARVGQEKFRKLLAGSPAATERDASQYHTLCVQYGVDPLFMLAMFNHESGMGRKYSLPQPTKSWGNVGYPAFGPTPVASVIHPEAKKVFPVYGSWAAGLEATLARLTSKDWVYHNRPTIRELFVHDSGQVWAPAGDMNDVGGYLNSVLRYMNDNTEEAMPNALAQLATRQSEPLLAWNATNNPKAIMSGQWPDYITIHETGNLTPGANAEMHRKFVLNGGGSEGVSFHAVVDERESIQLMPWNWVAWHAGDGTWGVGNRDSIAIETCQVGNFATTVRNLVLLTAKLMKEFNIPIEKVVPHKHWSGKNCPQFILNNMKGASWAGLRSAIVLARQMLDSAPTPGFQHEPGWLAPIVDTFDWGPDSAGIIVERRVLVYNDEKGKWYWGTWRADGGIRWQEVK